MTLISCMETAGRCITVPPEDVIHTQAEAPDYHIWFYRLKRRIVENGYTLGGSTVLGNIAVFLADPVNETVGLFAGNPCRHMARERSGAITLTSSVMPDPRSGGRPTLSVRLVF